MLKIMLIISVFFSFSNAQKLNKEEIKNIILSTSDNNITTSKIKKTTKKLNSDTFFRSMSIKKFAEFISQNDHINIMISDDVDAKTTIYMYFRLDKMLPAFKLALSQKDYKLSFKNGFYFVEKDIKKELKSYHYYQLRSDIYLQIKPLLSSFEHTYIASSNRLVIKCSKSQFISLSDILLSLDKLRSIYNFKVTVFDLDASLLDSEGFDTSILSKFTANQTSFFIDLLRVTQTKALPFLNSSVKTSFYSFIDFMSSKSFAKIEVSTIVNTLDGTKSNIENVTRVPILKSTTEIKETNTKNTNSFDYQNIGSILSIQPHYIDINTVYLDFNFNYSVLTESVRSGTDGNQYLPTYNQKTLNNIVRLKKGQSVLIGGFRRANKSIVDNSVPFLSELPFFGNFFTLKKDKKTNVVTYILIEYMDASISAKQVQKKIKKFTKSNYLDLF